MKIKATIVTCTHTSKHGTNSYSRLLKKDEKLDDVIEEIQAQCDYDETAFDEYFDSDISKIIIDTDDFEKVEEPDLCAKAFNDRMVSMGLDLDKYEREDYCFYLRELVDRGMPLEEALDKTFQDFV